MRIHALAAAAALAMMAVPAAATTIQYNNFNSTAGLQLNNAAAAANDGARNVLRVTPSAFNQSGSAFSTNAITLGADYSFSTRFTFNFNHQAGIEGADGLVFVVQTVSNTSGGTGGGIGYQGLTNSLGVEFDNYNNGGGDGNSGNHAGIDFGGSVNSSYINTSLPFTLDSATDLTTWIDYDGSTGNLLVLLNNSNNRGTATTLFNVNGIDLASVLGTNTAFVGFTSGTGSGYANHDVVNWEFRDEFAPITGGVPEPATWAMMIGGFAGMGAMLRRRRALATA